MRTLDERNNFTCVLQMDNCLCLFSWVWSRGNVFSFRNNAVQKELRDWNLELEEWVFVPFWKNSARCQNSPRKKGGKRSRIVMSELNKLLTTQRGTNLGVSITLPDYLSFHERTSQHSIKMHVTCLAYSKLMCYIISLLLIVLYTFYRGKIIYQMYP